MSEMLIFENLDLKWWEKQDLESLLEEFPNLHNMTDENIQKLGCEMYRQSQYYADIANTYDTKGDALYHYLRLRQESEEKKNACKR